jgi:transposase
MFLSRTRESCAVPSRCPRCGGGLELRRRRFPSFRRRFRRHRFGRIEFRIQVGRCRCCRRRVQGRHPRQTSNAIGGAASQLGPRALALDTQLNKGLGLPYGKTATVLEQAFGLRVSRGGLCQANGTCGQEGRTDLSSVGEASSGQPQCDPG